MITVNEAVLYHWRNNFQTSYLLLKLCMCQKINKKPHEVISSSPRCGLYWSEMLCFGLYICKLRRAVLPAPGICCSWLTLDCRTEVVSKVSPSSSTLHPVVLPAQLCGLTPAPAVWQSFSSAVASRWWQEWCCGWVRTEKALQSSSCVLVLLVAAEL